MKKINFRLVFATVCILFSFSSCEDEMGGLTGWYMDTSDIASASDFAQINNAIENNELLSSYRYGGQTHNYYATPSLFISEDGRFTCYESNLGRVRFTVDAQSKFIQIENNNTIHIHYGWLYVESATSKKDWIYRFYSGPYFGTVSYYDEDPSSYTYTKIDNKIFLSNGDIYTIVEGGLRKDGESHIYKKFNPKDYVEGGKGNKESGQSGNYEKGTRNNPLTIPEAIAKAIETGETPTTEEYFIKGKIASVTEQFGAYYGNATFVMTDASGTGFYAYRIYYKAKGRKWTEGDEQINEGDEVIICGQIVNYKNMTPETQQDSGYLVEIVSHRK